MSRSKNKNRSEVEYLKGEVRRLKKQLRQSEKQPVQEETQEVEEVETKAVCPKCKEGHIKHVISILNKDIFECTECDFRRVIKNE